MATNPYMPQNTAAPSAQLAGDFRNSLQSGNFAGAAAMARNAGYSDADIANYVGANQLRDDSGQVLSTQMASDWLGKNQAPQNLGMGGSQGQSAMQGGQTAQSSTQTTSQPSAQFGRNPWIAQQAQALQAQSNQNLQQNVLPGIGRGAQAAGMYGSSRQGIAEGQAMGNAQTGLNSAIANLYSQSYGQDQQYDLASRGLDNSFKLGMGNLDLNRTQANNSYDLGLRSNDLGFANLDANINQQNFGNQLQSANFGLGVYDRMNGYNQQNIQNATNMQNTPVNYFNQFNQNANAIAGQGGTSTNSQVNPGNPYIGALGGLQLGSQLFGGKP